MPIPFIAGRAHAGQPSHPADLLQAGLSGPRLVAGELVTHFVPWRTPVLWHLFSPRGGTKTVIFLSEKDHDSEMLKLRLPGQPGREVPAWATAVPMGTVSWMPRVLDSPPWPTFPAGQHLLCCILARETTRGPCRCWEGTVGCKIKMGEHSSCRRMGAWNNLTVVLMKYSGNLGRYLLMPSWTKTNWGFFIPFDKWEQFD